METIALKHAEMTNNSSATNSGPLQQRQATLQVTLVDIPSNALETLYMLS